MNGTVKEAIAVAHSQVGYRELGNNWTKFARDTHGLEWAQNQPWCSTYQSWIAQTIGLRANVDYPNSASCLEDVRWFKAHNRWSNTPHVGDWVLYGANGGTHVELVIGVGETTIKTNGGNTSGALNGRYFNGDGVYEKAVARGSSRIYGYGRPAYHAASGSEPAPKPPAPPEVRTPQGDPVLQVGDTGEAVRQVQEVINKHYKPKPLLVKDGKYGGKTAGAVKRVQVYLKFAKKDQDGKWGPKTAKSFRTRFKVK